MASPAKHKNFLFDTLPDAVYFDTNFVVHSLIKQARHYYKNLACRYFISRLLESKTKVYFSAIIFPEFWHSAFKIAIAEAKKYREERQVYEYIKKYKKRAVKESMEFIHEMQKAFDRLMTLLNETEQRVYVIDTQRTILDGALRFMNDYQLLSYDAIHFASATISIPATDKNLEKPSVFDIATLDSDFEGVECEYLKVWSKGATHDNILKFEKKLPKGKLQPDGLIAKETKNKNH